MDPALSPWLDVLKSFGFPVFVAGWLMLRTESRLDKITAALHELARTIERYQLKG